MRVALAFLPFLFASPALAQLDPGCANVRIALPAELSGWSDQVSVSAGIKPGEGATLPVGQAARVSLHPARHLLLDPVPPAAGDGNGGTITIVVTTAGTYRIALGGDAALDVVHAGKLLSATPRGHGPKCTGVRKMVDFTLAPGDYVVQLSGSAMETINLLVTGIA